MSNVAHESALARPGVEALAQRLLALRGEIDEILVGLACAPAASGEPTAGAHAPIEEPAMVFDGQTVDRSAAREDDAVKDSASGRREGAMADAPAADDLALISGIDDQVSDELNDLGIVAYAQIARWSAADVADVAQALGLSRAISKENWIEQAAMLASGKPTAYAGGGTDYPLDYSASAEIEAGQSQDADVFMLERVVHQAAFTPDRPTLTERLSACVPENGITQTPGRRMSSPVVPSLEPYRGIPRHPSARRRLAVSASRGRMALGLKVAACLIMLVVAGLVVLGRDAWGSGHGPMRKKAALPLQVHGSSSDRAAAGREAARRRLVMRDVAPASAVDLVE